MRETVCLSTREHFSAYANVPRDVFGWRDVSRISGHHTWRFDEEEKEEEEEEEEEKEKEKEKEK